MFMEISKLDVIFSIGPACRPAYHLKRNYFRCFACPLDWQYGYSLKTVIHLFETKFEDFFVEIEEDTDYDGKHRKIKDKQNQVYSIHHFRKEVPIKEEQTSFCETMLKRFERLHEIINKSGSIGLLCNRSQSLVELEVFLNAFSRMYPQKKIILINIRDEDINERKVQRYAINEYLEIHEYRFRDNAVSELETWKGNCENWAWVLRHYELSHREDVETFLPDCSKE